MTRIVSSATPTSVYRYYDRFGILLYVGITSRSTSRNQEHNKSKIWWHYVAWQEVDHYPSREVAHRHEVELIEKFAPPFNVQHNRDHARMKLAYLAVIEEIDSAHERDPRNLLERLNRKLPFEVVRHEGSRMMLRSQATHVAITARLHIPRPTRMHPEGTGGEGIGQVLKSSMQGPFLELLVEARKGIWGNVYGLVKPLAIKGPPKFKLYYLRATPGVAE